MLDKTIDNFEEGGIVGIIQINGIKKSFACELKDNITKKELRQVLDNAAIFLGVSLDLKGE